MNEASKEGKVKVSYLGKGWMVKPLITNEKFSFEKVGFSCGAVQWVVLICMGL